jgi:hypothetical protein
MARVSLPNGKWFDDEKAVKFSENTWWNGHNHISSATGSQWEHEALYHTKTGSWVLNTWSQRQGSGETYEVISEQMAIQWLIAQQCFDDKEMEQLPSNVLELVKAGFQDAEI